MGGSGGMSGSGGMGGAMRGGGMGGGGMGGGMGGATPHILIRCFLPHAFCLNSVTEFLVDVQY
jgi:hypothetical protein